MGVPMEYGVPTTNVGQSTGSSLLGALPVVGGVANAVSSFFTNQAQIKANKEAYERQRVDSLADWNMQNKYNSPSQQMQRFKEAGLNPNLIYGQMSNSPTVRSTDYKPPNFVSPQIEPNSLDILSRTNNYQLQDKAIKQADATRALTEANTLKAASETDYRNLSSDIARQMLPMNIENLSRRNALLGEQRKETEMKWKLESVQKNFILPAQYDKTLAELKNINDIMKWRGIAEPIQNHLRNVAIQSGLIDNLGKPIQQKGNQINNQIQQIEAEMRKYKLGSDIINNVVSAFKKLILF